MLRKILISCLFLAVSNLSYAAVGGVHMEMQVNLDNKTGLQRGAKTFVNYCMGCHSLNYMRYNRIGEDLGISEQVLKDNLMFGTDKVGDTMSIAMKPDDALQYFGVVPPDLSVTARSRGADWLYGYFKTFYVDEKRPFGFNNLQFKDVGMPHVLVELQGLQRPVYKTTVDAEGKEHTVIDHLELEEGSGVLSVEEYDQLAKDLVNFMVYVSEPIQIKRKQIGVWVLLYLFLFAIVAYVLKKEYWRDIH